MGVQFDDLARSRVLVVGDVCEDLWVEVDGNASKENDVRRLVVKREVSRTGMAGMALSIGRAIGVDAVGSFLAMQSVKIRRTRYFGINDAVFFRVDRNETFTYGEAALDQVYEQATILDAVERVESLLICDHGYGMFPDQQHAARWIKFGLDRAIPIVVDPRKGTAGAGWWSGATVIKASDAESRTIKSWQDDVAFFVRTRGSRGWSLQAADQRGAIEGVVRAVKGNPLGAGDAFAIALAAALPHGDSSTKEVRAACELAAKVAAWHVEHPKLAVDVDLAAVRKKIVGKSGIARAARTK